MIFNARMLWLFDGDREPPKEPPYPCAQCGALLTYRRGAAPHQYLVQHGDNPEALLRLQLDPAAPPPIQAQQAREAIAAWAERVHAYERGGAS